MRDVVTQGILIGIFSLTLPAEGIPHEIASRLRNAIETGLLEDGCRIKQQVIADICHVSRMPVREALRMLDAQGYLQNRKNRGYVVLSNSEVQQYSQSIQELVAPIKRIYDSLDSSSARHQVEVMILRLLRGNS